jgi:hypothetical protein
LLLRFTVKPILAAIAIESQKPVLWPWLTEDFFMAPLDVRYHVIVNATFLVLHRVS